MFGDREMEHAINEIKLKRPIHFILKRNDLAFQI